MEPGALAVHGPFDLVIGIDPGSKTTVVALDLRSDGARLIPIHFRDVPGIRYPVADLTPLTGLVAGGKRPLVVFEAIAGLGGGGAMWGADSAFSFGVATGYILGAVLQLGWHVVTVPPREWQKDVGAVGSKEEGKLRARRAYNRLFPHGPLPVFGKTGEKAPSKDHVDGLLIAWCGVRAVGGELRPWAFPVKVPQGKRAAKRKTKEVAS